MGKYLDFSSSMKGLHVTTFVTVIVLILALGSNGKQCPFHSSTVSSNLNVLPEQDVMYSVECTQ